MDNKAKNIFEKLQNARVLLQKRNLKKSGKNSFAKFEYFELKDFLPSANEIMEEVRLTPIFNINNEEAMLDIYDQDSLETITFKTPVADATTLSKEGKPVNLEIQTLGSKHTYLKRYLYLNAFEIVEGDSIDPNTGNPETEPTKTEKQTPKATDKQISLIEDLYTDEEMEGMAQRLEVNHISEITIEQASKMISSRKGKN